MVNTKLSVYFGKAIYFWDFSISKVRECVQISISTTRNQLANASALPLICNTAGYFHGVRSFRRD